MAAYELPPMYEAAGAPYAWPWPEANTGCPRQELVQGTWAPVGYPGFVAGLPGGAVAEYPSLEIAGALFAHRMGHNYEAIAGYLDARAGEMIAGYAPWEEAISGSFLGGITRKISSVAKTVARAATVPVTKAAAALVHGVRQYNPVAMAKMAAVKARALAGSLKDSVVFHVLRTVVQKSFAPALAVIRTASHVLPYAQTVVSFVPGIGSGVSAALGAAQVLADGRPISDMAVAAVRGAIPGGPLAQSAFDTVWKVANGKRVDTALLSTLRDRIPGGELAKRAADTALALAAAKTAQDRKRLLQGAAVQALASRAPQFPALAAPRLPNLRPPVPSGLPRFV